MAEEDEDDWSSVSPDYDWSRTPPEVARAMATFRRLTVAWLAGTLTMIGGIALTWVGRDTDTGVRRHPILNDIGFAVVALGVLVLAALRIHALRQRRRERRRVNREQMQRGV